MKELLKSDDLFFFYWAKHEIQDGRHFIKNEFTLFFLN